MAFLAVLLARFGGPFLSAQSSPTAEDLIAALQNPDAKTREAAARSLGMVGNTLAVPALAAALADKESSVQRAAAEALGVVADPAAIEPLIAAFRRTDSRVYEAAALAVIRLGPGIFDRLVTEAGSDNEYGRRGTAFALGALGDRGAVELLVRLLSDRTWNVRVAAGEALRKMNDVSTIPAVSALLADRDPTVVRYIARTLAEWKDVQAEAALDSVLTRKPVNLAAVAGAYQYYTEKAGGCRGSCSIQQTLIDALMMHGMLPMPQDFYYCRSEALRMAARVWAQHRGQSIASWSRPPCVAATSADGSAPVEGTVTQQRWSSSIQAASPSTSTPAMPITASSETRAICASRCGRAPSRFRPE